MTCSGSNKQQNSRAMTFEWTHNRDLLGLAAFLIEGHRECASYDAIAKAVARGLEADADIVCIEEDKTHQDLLSTAE